MQLLMMMMLFLSLFASISCILDRICTVTGPTVIDFLGQVNSVDDRCAYSLMSGSSVPDLYVLANFQERRRKDVSFLDSVTLRLNKTGVHIQLEQGGRVQVSCLHPVMRQCGV